MNSETVEELAKECRRNFFHPCSEVEKLRKYTLFWMQEIMQNYVLYCIVLYCNCIVL